MRSRYSSDWLLLNFVPGCNAESTASLPT